MANLTCRGIKIPISNHPIMAIAKFLLFRQITYESDITQAWKSMAQVLQFLQLNLWWTIEYQGFKFGLMMDRGFVMYENKVEVLSWHLASSLL